MVLISVCRIIKPRRALSTIRHLQRLQSGTSNPIPGGPVAALLEKIDKGELIRDDYQVTIAEELQKVYQNLQTYQPPKPSLFGKLFGGHSSKEPDAPRGL
jgi:predicted ATPase